MCGIFNDGDAEPVIIPKIAHFVLSLSNPLYLFQEFNFKAGVEAKVALDKEGDKDSPLGVGMDATPGALGESSQEEGCTGGRLKDLAWYSA